MIAQHHHMHYSLCKIDVRMKLGCGFWDVFQLIKFPEVLSTSLKALPLLEFSCIGIDNYQDFSLIKILFD